MMDKGVLITYEYKYGGNVVCVCERGLSSGHSSRCVWRTSVSPYRFLTREHVGASPPRALDCHRLNTAPSGVDIHEVAMSSCL